MYISPLANMYFPLPCFLLFFTSPMYMSPFLYLIFLIPNNLRVFRGLTTMTFGLFPISLSNVYSIASLSRSFGVAFVIVLRVVFLGVFIFSFTS